MQRERQTGMSDERTLLRGVQTGDTAAFSRLRDAMHPRLQRFVIRLIGRQDSVEEIVQDTFTALYLKLERIESADHLWPFVFRVARNLCYDELRRRNRYDFVSVSHGSEDTHEHHYVPVDSGPLPDDDTEMMLIVTGVRAAMERLPEQQRQALLLYGEMGLSYKEVADAMSIDIGTVKAHIHNGRKKLRTLIAPDVLRVLGIGKENTDGNR